ncbi:MAG: alpha/beta hydrolase [Solirubrobacterales bacterium]
MPIPDIEGFTSHHADVAGTRLHYWIGGVPDGPPVLLWHGFLGTGYTWRKVMTPLARAGCAVLVPDMRGYGDSDKPAGTAGYDGRALAEELRALRTQIAFAADRPLTLVGFDMGAPGALLWTADHPEEIARLVYVDEPVLLGDILARQIVYMPEVAAKGSMWWWLMHLAPGAQERLIVGNERAYLSWFYDRVPSSREGVGDAIDEYLRTFAGTEGVLGALGVYRAAFTTIEQTEPLAERKLTVPVTGIGGEHSRGAELMRDMLETVAEDVSAITAPGAGHFVPEERPQAIIDSVLAGPTSAP